MMIVVKRSMPVAVHKPDKMSLKDNNDDRIDRRSLLTILNDITSVILNFVPIS